MIIALVHRTAPTNAWCVLRHATPGDRIATLCATALPYEPVELLTLDLADHDSRMPHNMCPACRRELAAKTPGAAVCVEPVPPTLESRVSTRDLGPERTEADGAWADWRSEYAVPEAVIEEMSRGVTK